MADDGQTWDLEAGAEEPAEPAAPSGMTRRPLMPEERYRLGAPLGQGGFSVVYRAEDAVLGRAVAMKLLKPSHLRVRTLRRFENAARICAQLSHQAIVQILDVGVWPDNRPFLTMPIVEGRTLSAVIAAEHARMSGRLDVEGLRRMVTVARVACDALAYAHDHGVLHRDVKPSNIMVSDYNEVIVLDWGLARHQRDAEEPQAPDEVVSWGGADATKTGSVQGTSGYMAPEQAQGRTHDIDQRTDVFALGGVLYSILTGEPPWGKAAGAAFLLAKAGTPRAVPARPGLPAPLAEICERALQIEPAARYPDAQAVSEALSDWLVGLEATRRATALVQRSDETVTAAKAERAAAAAAAAQARALLAAVAPNAPEVDKHAGWAAEDRAAQHRRAAELLDIERVQLLHTALSVVDLPAAHDRLADIYRAEHHRAEAVGDRQAADRHAFLLRAHNRGRYDAYLRGVGRLVLQTTAPVSVTLFRHAVVHRRLQAVEVGRFQAPLSGLELPIGTYLAVLRAADGVEVRLPLEIRRSEETNGALSPGEAPVPVWIPPADRVPAGMVYVPAGPFWSGGGDGVFGAPLPLRRVWVDGFFVDRYPVTNTQYIAFLDALVEAGQEEAALAHCPRERQGRPLYGRDDRGRFILVPDYDGDLWEPDWPVLSLTVANARAFAAWRSAQTGVAHRLPWELEWEKAARGADQRTRVWGTDAVDPTWCRIGMSATVGQPRPASVYDYPADESPYGVRGLAGNVSDVCGDEYTREGPAVVDGRWTPQAGAGRLHPIRGAAWNAHPSRTHIGVRGGMGAKGRSLLCGFRLVAAVAGLDQEDRSLRRAGDDRVEAGREGERPADGVSGDLPA